tara:strand:- start:7020 stop:8813 length:1794 start_codon:yes stop_codon:yes gene_type:complete
MAKKTLSITQSSTAEYFSKNLQQVGFSSQTKAVLTTLKEAVDNSLDACEDAGILPEISVTIEKKGKGSLKNADKIMVRVEDNGPGIGSDDISKVFGEYLASSKFGRGRCSRGQQGIGISAATTWSQLTNATGAKVITKTANQRKAVSCMVEVDIKNNKGVIKNRETIDWDRPHGTSVEFVFDGRIQINGDAGLMNYLMGNVLVNPHVTLHYQLPDEKKVTVERVTEDIPKIPHAVEPHPHTMKLGEFIAHSHLYGKVKVSKWLKTGFSRVGEGALRDIAAHKNFSKKLLDKNLDQLADKDLNVLYQVIQDIPLKPPSTNSVLSIGEEGLARSIQRLGEIDFFSVVTRRPAICDFKPVQIEVAVARLLKSKFDYDEPVQVLRFANRVPLQFDKASCAIVQAITTVNWRSYGLSQPKKSLPQGPYIVAVSMVSPFIKFKNASKETIDSSDELTEEIRRALMQAGQRLSRHIKREKKANELEEKIKHIEQFGPILVDTLSRIVGATEKRRQAAAAGLAKLLGRDTKATESELSTAESKLEQHLEKRKKRIGEPSEKENSLKEEKGTSSKKKKATKKSAKKKKVAKKKKTTSKKKKSKAKK